MTAWLLTWLWQGLVLAFAMSAAFRLLPRLNAATRYCIWWLTLAALGSLGSWSSWGTWDSSGAAHLPAVAQSVKAGPTHLILIPSAPDALIAIVVGIWLAIALVLLVRVVPGIHAVFQLRDRCTNFPRDVEAQLPLWLEAQERGRATRPARLMLCDAVRGATVLGFHCPYIAVPPSLLKALTRDELDLIILHEHAHVQRWDDWTRLAQTLLQASLWIHPATAIIGRRLDLEREMACDEWVVARTGLPKAYARCLTRAAEVRGRIGMEPLLGPALFTRRRDLIHRVNRLLAVRGRTRRNVSVLGAVAGACALMMATIQLRAIPLVGELAELAPAVTVRLKPDTTYFTPEAPALHDEPTNPPNLTNPTNLRTHEPTNSRTPEPAFALRASASAQGASASAQGATADKTAGKPDEPTNPTNQRTLEPYEPDELLSLSARSFDGRYATADVPAAPENRAPWQMAGAVGAEIGASARKTSVGIANTLTRAGVSLARRF